MAKQLNLQIGVKADTSQAKRALQDLQNSINGLMKNSASQIGTLPLTKELQEAQSVATRVSSILKNSMNVDTGSLDLSKFSQQLQSTGLNAEKIRQSFQRLGPEGSQAFLKLSQSIMSAQAPMMKLSSMTNQLWTVLKNTMRWQLSSAAIHGAMSAISGAYNYAKRLDESLNNIRIVTEQNTEQMAKFAAKANEAAKALSTTTTSYTDAALIYYQQGLSDKEVEARTNVTIKMANASGQAAQTVSDQMTAVWNNFYNGSKSLEYYADVMTALGAATASSSEEIATGLEKFAAVSETVGLSYDYAASALATVTATTRQSADVVGTAFKTLFARIQDLELGETLEDGTTLGKYAQALAAVGISIKDANGGLRDMNDILDEMGAKWDTLAKDTQVALAQNVAGTRQYTQLVALMDNWDYFKENLEVAQDSEGTLQKQADIYAESWEGAQKRVSAAWETLYNKILKSDFFIELLNNIEKFIGFIDRLIDSMGGLPGLLSAIFAILTKIFSSQIAASLQNMVYNIGNLTGKNAASMEALKESFAQQAESVAGGDIATQESANALEMTKQRFEIQAKINQLIKDGNLNEQQIAELQTIGAQNEALQEQFVLRGKILDDAKQQQSEAAKKVYSSLSDDKKLNSGKIRSRLATANNEDGIIRTAQNSAKDIIKQTKAFQQSSKAAEDYKKALTEIGNGYKNMGKGTQSISKKFENLAKSFDGSNDKIEEANKLIDTYCSEEAVLNDAVQEATSSIIGQTQASDQSYKATENYVQAAMRANQAEEENTQATENMTKAHENLLQQLNVAKQSFTNWATGIVQGFQAISQISMGINSIVSGIQALKDDDLTGWDKWSRVLMSFGMGLPMVISGFQALSSAMMNISGMTSIATSSSIAHQIALIKEKQATDPLTAAKMKNVLASKLGIAADTLDILMTNGVTVATIHETKALEGTFIGKMMDVAANYAILASMPPLLAITLIFVAALAALAVTIIAVVAAAKWLTEAYNKDANAAKEAQKNAEELANAYKEAKQAYEDMIAAMDEYQSARDALDSLTKGTDAYTEALQKANDAAIKLIEQYGNLLTAEDYYWDDHKLIIKEEALERIRVQQADALIASRAAANQSKALAARADAQARQTEISRDQQRALGVSIGDSVGKSIVTALAAGPLIEGITGPIRTTLSAFMPEIAAIPGTLGAVGGIIANDQIKRNEINDLTQRALEALETDAMLFSSKEYLGKALNIEDEELLDALYSQKEELEELNGRIKETNELLAVENQKTAEDILRNKEHIVNAGNVGERVISSAGNVYGLLSSGALTSLGADNNGEALLSKKEQEALANARVTRDTWRAMNASSPIPVQSEEEKAAIKTITELTSKAVDLRNQKAAEALGLTNKMSFKITEKNENGGFKYSYFDTDTGETVEGKSVNKETIDAALAASMAEKQLVDISEQLVKVFSKLENSANGYDHALEEFLSDEKHTFKNASKNEFNGLQDLFENNIDENFPAIERYKALKDNVREYLNDTFNEGKELTDEDVIKFGFDTADNFYSAMYEEYNKQKDLWKDLNPFIAGINSDDISYEIAAVLKKTYDKIDFGPAGEAGAEKYIEGVNKILEKGNNLSKEDQENVLNAIAGIDWTKYDAFNQLKTKLKEFNIELDNSDGSWEQFIQNMRDSYGAQPNFANLKNDLSEISAILEELDFGSVIKDEDYERLIKYNSEWEKFFMLQANGQRIFIGNQGEMKKATLEDLGNRRLELRQRKEDANYMTDNWYYPSSGEGINWDELNAGTVSNFATSDNKYTRRFFEGLGYSQDRLTDIANETDLEKRQQEIKTLGELAKKEISSIAQDEKDLNDMFASSAKSVYELNQLYQAGKLGENAEDSLEAYNKQISVLMSSATTLSELQGILANAMISDSEGASEFAEEYTQNLIRLGEQYENCADEVREYEDALAHLGATGGFGKNNVEQAQEALEVAILIGESAKRYSLEADEIEVQTRKLQKEYDLSAEAAAKVAVANQRLNRGVSTLSKNWEEWSDILRNSDKTSSEYASTLDDTYEALADIVGALDKTYIPDDFLDSAEHLDLLEKAARGDIDAINQLGIAIAQAQIEAMDWNNVVNSTLELKDQVWSINAEQFNSYKETLLQGLQELANAGYVAGESADVLGADWVNALNQMALATNMSVEEMNAMLNEMGVTAKVDVIDVPTVQKVPTYFEHRNVDHFEEVKWSDSEGVKRKDMRPVWKSYTEQGESIEINGFQQVAQISTEDNPKHPQITYIGTSGSRAGGVSPSSIAAPKTSSKSSSAPKAKEPEKKDLKKADDELDRYHVINNLIQDRERVTEKLNKQEDRLWGADRLKAMKEESKSLKEQNKLLKEKEKEIRGYLDTDRENLVNSAMGFEISFDQNGNIINYEELMTNMMNHMNDLYDEYNAMSGEEQEKYKESLEQAEEDYEHFKDMLDQYEDTVQELEDNLDEQEDKFDEWQANNYEMIEYQTEVFEQLNENLKSELEYYFDKISDDVYKIGEAFSYLEQQLDPNLNALEAYREEVDKLKDSYNNGEINQAQYVEGLQKMHDSILDTLKALKDLDDEMMNYYGDALDKAADELSKYTDHLDSLNGALDHYNTLLELSGQSKDYDKVGTVLNAQLQNSRNLVEIAQNWYDSIHAQRVAIEEEYNAAVAAGNTAAAEGFKKELDAAIKAEDEAYDDLLSKTEAVAEKVNAIYQNAIDKQYSILEAQMTGGLGFDQLNESMDRQNKLQDEYLTKTNQIYETNKLLRNINQDIDKTDNKAAKDRLGAFANEINQLQQKGKLSKLELEIAQARYKQLQAQIALEEAQNAKSTVRLTRDNEGNYGYVYTADQNKVNDAEQAVADADNDVYNIKLNASNEYAQKELQARQELAQKLKEIDDDLELTEEERAKRKALVQQEYYDLIGAYSDLYAIGQENDQRVVNDAWVNNFTDIINDGEEWKKAITGYNADVTTAFKDWEKAMNDPATGVQKQIGESLDDLKEKTKTIATESDKTKQYVIEEVLPQLDTQLKEALSKASEYFRNHRQGVKSTILLYEQLVREIGNLITKIGTLGDTDLSEWQKRIENSLDAIKKAADTTTSSLKAVTPVEQQPSSGGEQPANTQQYRDSGSSKVKSKNHGVKDVRTGEILEKVETLKEAQNLISTKYAGFPYLVPFKSGGYTGEWGQSGKLAMLHEKELVLNKDDTQNILAAVDAMRDITASSLPSGGFLDSILAAIDGIGASVAALLDYTAQSVAIQRQTLDQQVSIQASFPNVSNRGEIEAAFDNLVNRASQYVLSSTYA